MHKLEPQVEVRRLVRRSGTVLHSVLKRSRCIGWSECCRQIASGLLPGLHQEPGVTACVCMSKDGDPGQAGQELQLHVQVLAGGQQQRGPGRDPRARVGRCSLSPLSPQQPDKLQDNY